MVIETKFVIGWFKLQLWMWVVDLNYNLECDWLIELSYYKLSDNNLASELVENRSLLKQITTEEMVIFMISREKSYQPLKHLLTQRPLEMDWHGNLDFQVRLLFPRTTAIRWSTDYWEQNCFLLLLLTHKGWVGMFYARVVYWFDGLV